jgi:hypothetical protein
MAREQVGRTGKDGKSAARTPAELERALKSDQCARALSAEVRGKLLEALLERRWELVAATCSDAWYDHCWGTGEAFPPPADTTPMRACRCPRCRELGRLWPAYYDAGREGPVEDASARPAPPASSLDAILAGADTPPVDPNVGAAQTAEATAPEPPPPSLLSYECYLESLDDWSAAQLPSSPSGMALRVIREGRIRLRRGRTKTARRR